MDLYEVEGKLLFNKYDIPTEEICLCSGHYQDEFKFPIVLKGQYLSGKRGKAGAIKVVNNRDEFEENIDKIKKISINNVYPADIHIAPFIKTVNEHYIGITLDRKEREFMLLYSNQGGMEIEDSNKIFKSIINDNNINQIIEQIKLMVEKNNSKESIANYIKNLWKLVKDCDATTAEINPLGELETGDFIAMDSKVVIDDNAWYRQKDRISLFLKREQQKTIYETEAESKGLSFVNLEEDGNIGVIAGGAGIGMATVDSIKHFGLKPFNFCDLGGGVTSEKTYEAVKLLLNVNELKGIVINIFGGVNNCKDMALGICKALDEFESNKKIVIKSRGFNQEEGWALYDERNIVQVRYGTTDDAVKKLVKLLEANYD